MKTDDNIIIQNTHEIKNNDATVRVQSDTNLGNETKQYEMEEGMPVGHQISPAMQNAIVNSIFKKLFKVFKENKIQNADEILIEIQNKVFIYKMIFYLKS